MRPDAFARVVWGPGPVGAVGRVLLTPLEAGWRAAVWWRNRGYDKGYDVHRPVLPAVSVGNVTVGGTGKTPIASWLAGRLLAAGATPGIVMRGYGADEPDVHRLLRPQVPVFVNADRLSGTEAARGAGCDVVVLDDAFQHRRIARVVDLVVVSADEPWPTRVLPAGPLREPWSALRRADLAVISVKVSDDAAVARVRERLAGLGVEHSAVVRLVPESLGSLSGGQESLEALAGRRILAFAGIGNPGAFFRQLQDCGADVSGVALGDHRAYGAADVAGLLARASGTDMVVCTLKDAVKLRQLWPDHGPPLWYVSQRVEPIDGERLLDDAVQQVLEARINVHH